MLFLFFPSEDTWVECSHYSSLVDKLMPLIWLFLFDVSLIVKDGSSSWFTFRENFILHLWLQYLSKKLQLMNKEAIERMMAFVNQIYYYKYCTRTLHVFCFLYLSSTAPLSQSAETRWCLDHMLAFSCKLLSKLKSLLHFFYYWLYAVFLNLL